LLLPYLWVKTPGESNGERFPEIVIELARNANPPLP
jgi:hypothetical protein